MEDFLRHPIPQVDKHLCQREDFPAYFRRLQNQNLLPVMINKIANIKFVFRKTV